MNPAFYSIRIRERKDWVKAKKIIDNTDLDLFIVDQAQVVDEVGFNLAQTARAEGLGICAAVTLKLFNTLGGSAQGVWSAGRRIISGLGQSCEMSNCSYGDLPWTVPPLGKNGCDSIWGSAVYITQEAYRQLEGFDLRYLQESESWVPNLMWDDLCLQALRQGIRIGYAPKIHAFIEKGVLPHPEESPAYQLWEEKWGWHPIYPNLYQIRTRWHGTSIARGVTTDLIEESGWTTDTPLVEGIMLTGNSLDKLRVTLAALAKTDYPNFSLKILMNGSSEEVRLELEKQKTHFPFPLEVLQTPVNIGVSPGLNWLRTRCSAPVIARLDDDIEPPPSWLREMVNVLDRYPFCGAVMPSFRVPGPDGEFNIAFQGRVYPHYCNPHPKEFAAPADSLYFTSLACGACLVYRRKAMELAGPFSLCYAPAQVEDIDHGLAVRAAGYDLMVLGSLIVPHYSYVHLSYSRNRSIPVIHQSRSLLSKWGRALQVFDTSLDRYGRIVELKNTIP